MKKYLLSAIFVLLMGCSSGDTGLFYTVQVEEPLSDSLFGELISIEDMDDFNSRVYVSTGSNLYSRSETSGWSKENPSGNYFLGGKMTVYNNLLYVVRNNSSSTKVYTKNLAGDWSEDTNITAIQTSLSAEVNNVFSTSSLMYISLNVSLGLTEDLYQFDGTATENEVTYNGGNDPANILEIMEYNGQIYMLTSNFLYASTDGLTGLDFNLIFERGSTDPNSGNLTGEFQGMNIISSYNGEVNILVMTTNKGEVAHSTDGTTWDVMNASTGLNFQKPMEYLINGTTESILLPTTSGYYELTGGWDHISNLENGINGSVANEENYLGTSMDDTNCRFFFETSYGRLYLATYTRGLWLLSGTNWTKD